MNWFADNWPLLVVALAAVIVLTAVIRRLAKLAFMGVGLAVVGFVIWPMIRG